MRVIHIPALTAISIFLCGPQLAAAEVDHSDPHAAHRKSMEMPGTQISRVAYTVPNVELLDSSGSRINLKEFLADGRPVVVNFIFTTCTTICPVITATTLQMQKELADDKKQPDFVSISIDPDYDSADILLKYADSYGADWTFLTGDVGDVMSVLHAFDAYRGNKVNHFALTLMRDENSEEWTRIEGLTSARDLADIWRKSVL